MKYCNLCKLEKHLSDFHKRSSRASGLASNCKACVSAREKRRYEENRQTILDNVRAYNDRNREKINARQRKYTKENKAAIKAYVSKNRDRINKAWREKQKNNPAFAMAVRFRRRLNYALSNIGVRKVKSSVDFLGCSFEEFKIHLESKFTEGMSWDNRHLWEIDHILPMRLAKTEADVIRLSHYTNLQPLWRKDNRKKSGKVIV